MFEGLELLLSGWYRCSLGLERLQRLVSLISFHEKHHLGLVASPGNTAAKQEWQ